MYSRRCSATRSCTGSGNDSIILTTVAMTVADISKLSLFSSLLSSLVIALWVSVFKLSYLFRVASRVDRDREKYQGDSDQ